MRGKVTDKMSFLLAFILAARMVVPVYDYTEQDVKDLGDTMWLENGHTGGVGTEKNRKVLILTGAVVLNRMVSDDKWYHKDGEKTVYDVIMARGQYASKTRRELRNTDTPQWIYDLAEEMLIYGTTVPEYVVYQGQNPRLGTLWCPGIAGEYFATEKGHYMEGDGWKIDTNKTEYLKAVANYIFHYDEIFSNIIPNLKLKVLTK